MLASANSPARLDKADVDKIGTLEGKAASAYLDAITPGGKRYEMKRP